VRAYFYVSSEAWLQAATTNLLSSLRSASDARDSRQYGFYLASKGWAYLVGQGVPQDHDQAFKHFEQGRKQGDMAACGLLGWMHLEGLSTSRDIKKALDFLQEASSGGDAAAIVVLGSMYADGNGVEKSVAKALPLLHEGRKLGHRAANRMLGQLYMEGDGVHQDLDKASCYLCEAREQGDSTARKLLNKMNGAGVSASNIVGVTETQPQSEATSLSISTVHACLPSNGCKHHAQPCPKICRMHQRDGTCHYGSKCDFCHFDHHESIIRGPRRGNIINK